MCFTISKKEYKGNITYISDLKGYKVSPKNKIEGAILVDELFIVDKNLIISLIKKKIRVMLTSLDDESDSGDSRKALGDLERYKNIINNKYLEYLPSKYVSLLEQKIKILEREYKNNIKDQIKKEEYKKEVSKNYDNEISKTR